MARSLHAEAESWELAAPFAISRGVKSRADVVVATVRDGGFVGRGEGVPYPRYGESMAGALRAIGAFAETCGDGSRQALLEAMPPGAARNAIDCALWDLEARQRGVPVWELAGLPPPRPVVTAYTIGLGDAAAMALSARRNADRPLLKVKLGDAPERDAERLRAVREAAPAARLIVDANEGWSLVGLGVIAPVAAAAGVELIEQPLPAGADGALAGFDSPVPLGADESLHGEVDLGGLAAKYRVLNIKLDKTGGLTRALGLAAQARAMGFGVMVGCMVATSLSMAPAPAARPARGVRRSRRAAAAGCRPAGGIVLRRWPRDVPAGGRLGPAHEHGGSMGVARRRLRALGRRHGTHSLPEPATRLPRLRLHERARGAGRRGRVPAWANHIDRLLRTCAIMGLPIAQTRDQLIDACAATVRRNPGSKSLKISALIPSIEAELVPQDPRVGVFVCAYDVVADVIEQHGATPRWGTALSLKVERDITNRRPDIIPPQAKMAANYTSAMFAKWRARNEGFDEIVLLDADGYVAEAPTSNIFVAGPNGLVTPPEHKVLHGITPGVGDETRGVSRSALRGAGPDGGRPARGPGGLSDASSVGVWPVVRIDERRVGSGEPGAETVRLKEALARIWRGRTRTSDMAALCVRVV